MSAPRQVRPAPLRLHTLAGLDRGPGLETRLPQLFLLGFGLLAAVQLILTH